MSIVLACPPTPQCRLTCLCFASLLQMTYKRPFLLTTAHPLQNFLTEDRTFIPRCWDDDETSSVGVVVVAAVVAVDRGSDVIVREGSSPRLLRVDREALRGICMATRRDRDAATLDEEAARRPIMLCRWDG